MQQDGEQSAREPSSRDEHAGTANTPGAQDAPLERELGGNLPCIVCGYNLRGLSIRFVCPECGTPVRATILAVVDPYASELQPIRWPGMVAGALVLWATAALVAALLAWAPHLSDLLGVIGVRGISRPEVALPMAWSLAVSGFAALLLVRPHRSIALWKSAAALAAALAYVPLVILVCEHQLVVEGSRGARYLGSWHPTARAMWLGLCNASLIGAMALLIRPLARVMVARSLLLRSGRVDRQTLFAVTAAAGIMGAGYVCGWVSVEGGARTGAEIARGAALILITLGSALVTLGLFGCVVDSVRIAMAILQPGPSLKQVLHGGATGTAPFSSPAPSPAPDRKSLPTGDAGVSGGKSATSIKSKRESEHGGDML